MVVVFTPTSTRFNKCMSQKDLEIVKISSIKIIKIFLASSSELKGDREQFEIFINRKNKEYIRKGIFLELVMWENFLDAMSPTRLQDEYNKAIASCDIFVSLFHTKVGQYIAIFTALTNLQAVYFVIYYFHCEPLH